MHLPWYFTKSQLFAITIILISSDFRRFWAHCQSIMLAKTRWSVFPKVFFDRTSSFGTLFYMVCGSAKQNFRLAHFTGTKFCSFQYTCFQANLKFPPNWNVFQCPNMGYFMLMLLRNEEYSVNPDCV